MTEEIQEWKRKVFILDVIELRLDKLYKNGQITNEKRKKIKRFLNKYWINIWDYHPDISKSERDFFRANFG